MGCYFNGYHFLSALIQYIINYNQVENTNQKHFIRRFFWILGLRASGLFLSAFMPVKYCLPIASIVVVGTWSLPGIVLKDNNRNINMQDVAINFPHIMERLSLLIIITFGEMIVQIALYFRIENFSIWTLFIFMIVANLFMIYIVEIDHLIDLSFLERTAYQAIYLHNLILFGLSFITVSLSVLSKSEVNLQFISFVLNIGVGLFLLGTLAHNRYNKISHRVPKRIINQIGVIWVLSIVVSMLVTKSEFIIVLTFIQSLLMAVILVRHTIKSNSI